MNSKRVCLLGFAKKIENDIKQYIIDHAQEYEISWVSANASPLDGVIINALFLETPQIEKYLNAVKCAKIAAYADNRGKKIAKKQNITAIDLNTYKSDHQDWLAHLLGTKANAANMGATEGSAPGNASSSTTNTGKQQDFHELIKYIKDRAQINITAVYENKTTCLNPAEGYAYINFPRDEIPGVELWHWHTTQTPPDTGSMRRINIDQWVFETIWQSKSTVFSVDASKFYKLIRWPQPFAQSGRTEALRLAAQIKFKPVTIADLVSKTDYSTNLVEQFLFATANAGQVESIQSSDAVAVASAHEPRREDPNREVKRGFIGRLRKKLGL